MKRESTWTAKVYTMATILWSMAVLLALVIPVDDARHKDVFAIPHLDKLVHILLFGILYLLFEKSARVNSWRITSTGILVMVMIYGIFCEGIQIYLKDRSFDILDIIANIMGSLIAFFIYKRNLNKGLWI